jgi:hypothetical protein
MRISPKLQAICMLIAVGVLLGTSPQGAQAPTLRRLQGIDELRKWFNAGAGHPRLIFLLSPT